MVRIVRAALFSVLAALPAPAAVAAEAYPQKPIRLILPFAAGGATDVLARAVSARLEEVLGTSMIIDNRGGAGGTLGTALAARAAPDGYTFLFTSASHTFTPSLYKDLPYDPLKDFKAVTMFASIPNLLVVHPSLPATGRAPPRSSRNRCRAQRFMSRMSLAHATSSERTKASNSAGVLPTATAPSDASNFTMSGFFRTLIAAR